MRGGEGGDQKAWAGISEKQKRGRKGETEIRKSRRKKKVTKRRVEGKGGRDG